MQICITGYRLKVQGRKARGVGRAKTVDRIQLTGNREPAIVILTDTNGRMCDANGTAERLFGAGRGALSGQELWSLVREDSKSRLRAYFDDGCPEQSATMHLEMMQADGTAIDVIAALTIFGDASGTRRVRLLGLVDTEHKSLVAELENRAEMLAGFIEASSEAMWCMEFNDPVDLRASEEEIVRQVFENQCHWRMCNAAMARLYSLPEDMDFNRQPVRSYFRRNPENETFVRQLIHSRFRIDAAPSVEYGHDDRMFYGENSVRCHVERDHIVRMWGTVRDVTELRKSQNKLEDKERAMRGILGALPDAVLVVDMSRRVIAMNPAFETTFGWTAESVLGRDVSPIIDLDARRPGKSRWFAQTDSRWIADVADAAHRKIRCDVRMAPVPADGHPQFVLSLRVVQARNRPRLNTERKRPRAVRRRSHRNLK
jgi:PAS domain S-box-containing protein